MSFNNFGNQFGSNFGNQLNRDVQKIRRSPLAITLVALFIAGGILVSISTFYADLLWFRSVGYQSVWQTTLFTKASLFIVVGLITALVVLLNVMIAYRNRPIYAPMAVEADNLERYRTQIEPRKKLFALGIFAFIFYVGGSSATPLWSTWLQFRNATEFGVKDPQYGLDISFFAFKLPMYQSIIGWATSTLIFGLIAAVIVHYLYSAIRLPQPGQKLSTTGAAQVQLSVLLGLIVLTKAGSYWLDRYALTLKDGRLITGLTYTDVNAVLPAKAILAAIAVICSILFFANIVRRSWSLPVAGVGLLLVSSLVIQTAYPAIIQQFQVKPSESNKEAPYIQRNIEATRAAYDIADVEIKDYNATLNASAGQLTNDANTISNIRLMDPNVLSATFRQLQQIKPYYTFAETLDIDRYQINNTQRDAVVAVRELNIDGNPARNWINDHLVYTHGFGFVAAYGNTVDADGKPNFIVGDLPPTSGLGKFEPRIYFGENVPDYSIIGGNSKTDVEFDYPDDASPNGQKNTTYKGEGGVPVGNLFNRLVFTIKYQEQRILLSNLINSESKILFNRNPRDRVSKVAPWLTLDGDPYPAVVDGKIKWIIDGYTTTAGYPYAQKTTLSGSTSDALTANSNSITAQSNQTINYIRNSVKATVDAYDGTVSLYEWDVADPVLKTWAKAYPGVIKPKSEISEKLMAHLRYPEDLFKVQRDILSSYHVQNALAFYGGQDFWRVPRDPSTFGGNIANQPPYYTTLQMPGEKSLSFMLATPFVPRGGRENLSAFAAVNASPGDEYGKITVLQLPRSTNIPGPTQVASNFEAKPEVATTLSLLRQGGSDVVLGNLLTLPVGGGLLYVQPVYVRATANAAAYPLLQKVLVSFGDQIGFDDNLKGALDQVFGGNSGTSASGGASGGTTATTSSLSAALNSARQALADAQRALTKGDFAAYGKAQDRLKSAINAAISAQNRK
ncbi:MAG: UPF0182 family protein [Candidatus Nanopelagicaceae bacterium]|nr:UPF0182 family protein [Candidatus Nanopelagicaceae bacterium]